MAPMTNHGPLWSLSFTSDKLTLSIVQFQVLVKQWISNSRHMLDQGPSRHWTVKNVGNQSLPALPRITLSHVWTELMWNCHHIMASCRVVLPPSNIMETNLELEQADRLSQSSIEQPLATQVRVTNSDRDEKVSALFDFASVDSWLA